MICLLETKWLTRPPLVNLFMGELEEHCLTLVSSEVDVRLLVCPRSIVRNLVRVQVAERTIGELE